MIQFPKIGDSTQRIALGALREGRLDRKAPGTVTAVACLPSRDLNKPRLGCGHNFYAGLAGIRRDNRDRSLRAPGHRRGIGHRVFRAA